MSREVFGDAPGSQLAERARYAITSKSYHLAPATDPVAGGPAPARSRRRHRLRVTATAAAVAVMFGASAWGGYAVSRPSPEADVAVTVAGAVERDRWSGRAVLTILVSNAGPGAVHVVGYAGSGAPDPGLTMRPPNPRIDAGGSVDLTVDLGLRCDQARPFAVPDLLIESEAGARQRLTPPSAVATITDFCATAARAVRPLRVASSSAAGDRLVLTISSPSGRPARIHAVSALGVPLVTDSLPAHVGREETAGGPGMARLRLVPPPQCPASWRETGIPASLLVETWSGGPATVSLHVGPPLIRWALDHVCPVP